jgi:hypothetical protein
MRTVAVATRQAHFDPIASQSVLPTLRLLCLISGGLAISLASAIGPFISRLHEDNSGSDTGARVEITADGGFADRASPGRFCLANLMPAIKPSCGSTTFRGPFHPYPYIEVFDHVAFDP